MPLAVILTALPVEYLAVRNYLTELQEKEHPQGTIYQQGKFVTNGQTWEVGIAEVGAGNTKAAVEAVRAIAYFQPNILLFVGIAGGIKDVAIGDVVVATDVYGYESGKVAQEFFTRPQVGKSAYALVERAKFEAKEEEWLEKLSSKPRVFVAPIAAGEKVVASKHSDIFQFLRGSYNDAIAVEMEGFGFLSAAFAYPNIKAIVIRGISDLIEGKNDDSIEPEEVRQKKASHHASAFAFQMLSKLETSNFQSTTNPSLANFQSPQDEPDIDNLPIQEPREYALDLLNRLLPSQLDTVIFKYGVELAHLSDGAPSQRSIELIRYALQKESADLLQLLRVIYKVAPHLKKSIEVASSRIPAPDESKSISDNNSEQTNDNTIYVERPLIEANCYQKIVQSGALLRLKGPPQMGKTRLMHRVLDYARKQDCETVTLSFALADRDVFQDFNKFCKWFCVAVGKRLGLRNKLASYWDDRLTSSKDNTNGYFQDYLLTETTQPLVLALDNVDLVFEHEEIAIDFCQLLRYWHDRAKRSAHDSKIWQKLRLVIVHDTDLYGSLDINSSPLASVGVPITLPEFNAEQLQDLAQQHGLILDTAEVEQLMSLVGGHPYLLQLAFEQIKSQGVTLSQLLQVAHTEAGIYSNHLRQHLGNLKKDKKLKRAFRKVVTKEHPVELESVLGFKLKSMGLVKMEKNVAKPRCELYRKYFGSRWSSGK
ncbi:MAG: hypothetical protein F6K14_16040 [Symploca sp. SIO2C1]|nr:hypothetical protein [Symploca sp. SIO2C1]